MRIQHTLPLLLAVGSACSETGGPEGPRESPANGDAASGPSVDWIDAGAGAYDAAGSPDTVGSPDVADSVDTPPLQEPDMAPPGDGSYWTLEPTEVVLTDWCWLVIGLETVPLEVQVPISRVCEFPGPVRALPDGPRRLRIEAWHWVRQAVECEGVTGQATRIVPLRFTEPGEWTVTSPGSQEPFELQVSVAEGGAAVGDGSNCRLNEDCDTGTDCIPVLYHGTCALIAVRCADSCSHTAGYTDYVPVGSDCLPEQRCDGDYGWLCDEALSSNPYCGEWWRGDLDSMQVCVLREGDTCADDADCPRGMGCMRSESGIRACDWTVRLDEDAGVSCTDSRDCAPGLECVENASGDRRCELRCHTAEMRCPVGSACVPESETEMPWVCAR